MATATSAVIPKVSAAVNPNAGAYQSYVAGEYKAGKPTASYSSALFDQTWKPVQNAAGQSQYDIARGGQEAASQRDAQLRQQALQRQMAQQGVSNSGIALKQQQIANVQGQQTLQSGLAGINVAELSAAETARNAALQRQYGAETVGVQNAQATGERMGTQAFQAGQQTETLAQTKELTYADLGLREQTIANQASQFTDEMSFKRWSVESGYTEAEAARAWQATENDKARAGTKEIAGMQISSNERITNANIASNEKINTNKDWLTQQGINIDSAKVYGYTDANGVHQAGSVENAGTALGLQSKTLDLQQQELWGYTDANGVKHAGKYDLLSAADKRSADSLYGFSDPITGTRVRGSLQNDQLIADCKVLETKTGVDTFYGYTDPQTGQHVAGAGELAAKSFGLKSRELEDQEKELYGYSDPMTGHFVPGKISLMSNADMRAANELYGYTDTWTGEHIKGSLELQKDKNTIEQQGMTIEDAKLKGYTDSFGHHVMGSLELGRAQEDNKAVLAKLDADLKAGLLDKQNIIDTNNAVENAKAQRYFAMAKNGTAISPLEMSELARTDPMAYESYLMGKEGKTEAELADKLKMADQYRAAQITNLDDPDVQDQVTKMFASWGVDAAKQTQYENDVASGVVNGTTKARDYSTLETGKSVQVDAETLSAGGATVPPGRYTVLKQENVEKKGKWDATLGNWRKDTGTATYLVDGAGNKIEVGYSVASTSKGADWWANSLNPLSENFWKSKYQPWNWFR